MEKCCDERIIWVAMLLIFLCFQPIASAVEEDPLKDMNLEFMAKENYVENKAKFISISGYIESRNQLRAKDVDEPVSLRQRL